jgi:hypothetical protein
MNLNLTDLLRLLLSQVVFNQMKADGVGIDLQKQRGHRLHQILEILSDDREKYAFYSYISLNDCQDLRAYREWLKDEDECGRRLVFKSGRYVGGICLERREHYPKAHIV